MAVDVLVIGYSDGEPVGSCFPDSGDLWASNLKKARDKGAFTSHETWRLFGRVSGIDRQTASYDHGRTSKPFPVTVIPLNYEDNNADIPPSLFCQMDSFLLSPNQLYLHSEFTGYCFSLLQIADFNMIL